MKSSMPEIIHIDGRREWGGVLDIIKVSVSFPDRPWVNSGFATELFDLLRD